MKVPRDEGAKKKRCQARSIFSKHLTLKIDLVLGFGGTDTEFFSSPLFLHATKIILVFLNGIKYLKNIAPKY